MADKVTGVNVEGRNYEFLAGQAVKGACTALSADWVKPVTLPQGTLLVDGLIVAIMFVNGTSVGWSGTKTVYSSDGENFFYDQAMTNPVTLPPPDCYNVSLISGDEYALSCFPVIVYGTHRLPVCDSRGHYAGGALWAAGDTVAALYLDEKLILLYSVVDEVKLGVPSPVSSNAVARDAVLKSEITNEVAVANMQSVTSNAVAEAFNNLGIDTLKCERVTSTNFNDFVPTESIAVKYYTGESRVNYSNAPTTFASFNEQAFWFILEVKKFGRAVIQTLYWVYLNPSNAAWYTYITQRKRVDVSWFPWHPLQNYVN